MDRNLGLADLLQADEWPLLVLFGIVSQLGDVWFLLLLGSVLFLAGADVLGIDRRRGLFVFALGIAAVVLVEVLKATFALPRPPGATQPPAVPWGPPGPLIESLTTADPPGFPSGHALGSTMVWGGLALVADRGTRSKRLSAASAIVALVCLSRLVIGVHYALDILIGVGVGTLTLAALYRVAERGMRPGRILIVAAVIGVAGLVTDPTFDVVVATGGAVGGAAAWAVVADATPARPTGRRATGAGGAVLALAGILFGVGYLIVPSPRIAALGTALAVAGAVSAPALGERLARR